MELRHMQEMQELRSSLEKVAFDSVMEEGEK